MVAFDSCVYAVDGENVFRYYQYTDLLVSEVFMEYVFWCGKVLFMTRALQRSMVIG